MVVYSSAASATLISKHRVTHSRWRSKAMPSELKTLQSRMIEAIRKLQ